jgi:hypothetical protein
MGMDLESLSCGQCGAPLAVPPSAEYVTCNHCHSQLVVRRTQSVSFTEKIDQIDRRTEAMADELAQLRFRSELAEIDRQWEQQRRTYLVHTKNGGEHEPSATGAIVGGVLAVGFGLVWTVLAASHAGSGMALFGLLFCGAGFGMAIYGYTKAGDFQRAKRAYERRRAGLRVDSFRARLDERQGEITEAPEIRRAT